MRKKETRIKLIYFISIASVIIMVFNFWLMFTVEVKADNSVSGHMLADCHHHVSGSGDQGGNEYEIREYHSGYNGCWKNGAWRYPDEDMANEISALAIAAAQNDNIGYDQGNRKSFVTECQNNNYNPGDITNLCDSDCSASTFTIIICAAHMTGRENIYADENDWPFTTSTEETYLTRWGFEKVVDAPGANDWDKLKPGDIIYYDYPGTIIGHSTIYVGDATATSSGLINYDAESINLDTVQKKLKFSGIPKTITYSGSKSFPDIFEFIKGLLDWIVGLLFLGLKIVAMGFTEICENMVNGLMHAVSDVTITISTSN